MTDYCGNAIDGTIVIKPHCLENLPNEIIDLILSYVINARRSKQHQQSLQNDLYQCCLISKQFYQQTNPLLWFTPVISNTATLKRFVACLTNKSIVQATNPSDNFSVGTNTPSHNTSIHSILPSTYHIRRLDINGLSGWDDMQFSIIIPSLHSLETLTIDDNAKANVTYASLQHLPHCCPNITTLGFVPTPSFMKQFISSIIPNYHQLCQIELCITYSYPDEEIFKSLLNCPSLTTLVLQNKKEGMRGECLLSRDMVVDMMALNQLKSLVFIGAGITPTIQKVFALVHHLKNVNAWPMLSSLRCDHGYLPFGDKQMIPFIESHPHLKCLYLEASPFSDSTLNAIGTHLPGLTHLRLGSNKKITGYGVYNLIRRCHDLKQADFLGHFRNLSFFRGRPSDLGSSQQRNVLTIKDMDRIRQPGDIY